MGNLKVFVAYSTMIPRNWKDRVNTETGHHQGEVVIVAASKNAAAAMLTQAGFSEGESKSMARALQLGIGTTVMLQLMESGVLDLKTPMILVYRRPVANHLIIRADLPDLPYVGRFVWRNHSESALTAKPMGLYVEPVTESTK